MRTRLDGLLTLLALVVLALAMNVARAHAAKLCEATCPDEFIQISSSCTVINTNQCLPLQCTGMVTCQHASSGTVRLEVPCRCGGGPSPTM